jgi:hypothetical protein
MALASRGLFDAMLSHALSSGLFETVNGYEPKRAPGYGLTAAVWVQEINPVPEGSGLAATSGVVSFSLRVFQNMLSDPQDAIDPMVMEAVDHMMGAYSGDFTLGGLIRNVDLLGATGPGLRAVAGYVNQDGKLYRVMTVNVPLVINDMWEQSG